MPPTNNSVNDPANRVSAGSIDSVQFRSSELIQLLPAAIESLQANRALYAQALSARQEPVHPREGRASSFANTSFVPLRQWIQLVLTSLGGSSHRTSPAYLEAALKIAVSLAEQICRVETLAGFVMLDGSVSGLDSLLPNSAKDWADYVMVALGDDMESSNGNSAKELPATTACEIERKRAQDNVDEQRQMELFQGSIGSLSLDEFDALHDLTTTNYENESRKAQDNVDEQRQIKLFQQPFGSFSSDEFDAYRNSATPADAVSPAPSQNGDDIHGRFGFYLESFQIEAATGKKEFVPPTETNADSVRKTDDSHQQHSHRECATLASELKPDFSIQETKTCNCCKQPTAQDHAALNLRYINVKSAHIQCTVSETRRSHSNTNNNALNDKGRRMYHLGLIFYQLFSGGETPNPALLTLASMDNAFVSLSTMTLVKSNQDEKHSNKDSKRHQGSSSEKVNGVCQVSCEYLRLIGVPSPVCTLIFNMLDCIYGDLSGKDCYSTIDELLADLKLMMEKPAKFLRGLNINDLSNNSLTSLAAHLDKMRIPRDKEINSIKACYRRCASGSSELVVIQGESGSGKSWISECVRQFVVSEGGIFLTGKFEEMNQPKPFAAIASAFDQYCDLVIENFITKDSDWAKSVAFQLPNVLGRDACHLISVIPKLGLLIKKDASHTSDVLDMNCELGVQRLHHLFCLLLEVILSNSQVSICLCMDDIQWADQASIAVLARLMMHSNGKLLFLGCCRDDEMKSDHPFWKMLTNVRTVGMNVTTIELKGVGEGVLNGVMSELLCLSPRLVKPLSNIIHNKTRGNILFFSQLVLSLHRDGLIYLDLGRGQWMWNEEKILSSKLPVNIALCFINGIRKRPLDLQAALHTLSMFGTSIKCEYVELLEKELALKLKEPLKQAAVEGLVIYQKGQYHFCHDCIQQASYNIIEGQFRRSNHLMYGRCLIQRSAEIANDDMLFVAVNQINLAGPLALLDENERFAMATYNMLAGKKSMTMSAFTSAYSFFKHGISFLVRTNHWDHHYKFSLTIYELACMSALAASNLSGVQIHFEQLLRHAKCFDDTLNAQYIVMVSLIHSNLNKAAEKGVDIVKKLGEDIPLNPTPELLDYHIQQTQSMIRGITEEQLLNHTVMTDRTKLTIMKFLARLQSVGIHVPAIHKLVIVKMVKLSMSDGISPHSAFGFACFGSFLGKLGNLTAAHRFIVLAKALHSKFDAKEPAGEYINTSLELYPLLIAVVAEVQCYIEPVLAANELRVQGESEAVAVGDSHWACLCRLQYCGNMLWAGENLSFLKEKLSQACLFIKQHEINTILGFFLALERFVDIMLGNETRRLTMDELCGAVMDDLSPRHQIVMTFNNLYLSLLFNDGALQENCEAFFRSETKSSCFLMFSDSAHAFCAGLACFQIYRQTKDRTWLKRGRSRTEQMKGWVEQGSEWNFKHKLLLMQAEDHYSNGNLQLADNSYKSSITYAKLHKFQNDEALAYEMYARFYYEIGNLAVSMGHYTSAHKIYTSWGAIGKAKSLFAYTTEKFTNALNDAAL